METNSEIGALIRKMESDYTTDQTQMSKYVSISQWETLNKIEAYLNSKHTTGDTDSKGRDKPFFNISIGARNIWYRATDIDRKNIKVKPGKYNQDLIVLAATCKLQDWMTRDNFGQFLNDWGLTLATYGSAVSKHIVKENTLYSMCVPWNRTICDTIDFDNNPVIEKLQLTPAQLKKRKGYDQKMVDELLDTIQIRKMLDKQTKDNKTGYVELYEIHGELPKSYLTGKEEDKDEYEQQMQVVSFLASKEQGNFDDFVLVKGKEDKSPYQKDDLIRLEGQTLSIGAIQNLFEAQWMINHSVKAIKDQLDLASKLIFQTSDGAFIGNNVFSDMDTGDILVHQPNQPLTQLQNNSHDITSLQNFGQQWKALGNEINGISEAMQGLNQPAGSAWRQTEALLQESHSLFELMTENKGLALEKMLRTYQLPFFRKQLSNSKEMAAVLDSYNISKIDAKYVPKAAAKIGNEIMKKQILSGQVAQQADFQAIGQEVQKGLNQQGNIRYLKPSEITDKTWADVFKDLEWDVEVDITGEQKDIQEAMTTLETALKVVIDPSYESNPRAQFIVNKILELSGTLSPLEIASIPPAQPTQAPTNKVSESMSYKDAPEDVRRQIEQQAGLVPSKQQQAQQTQPQPVGA